MTTKQTKLLKELTLKTEEEGFDPSSITPLPQEQFMKLFPLYKDDDDMTPVASNPEYEFEIIEDHINHMVLEDQIGERFIYIKGVLLSAVTSETLTDR